ncbi:hypothetical protein ACWKSP_25880 [Micromonosporaceae bacterium Da 78-11]
MSRTGTFHYQVQAGDDPTAAIALFADLSQHAELHPLIVKVESAPPPDGALRRFVITDRMAYGPLRFPITYVADILSVTADRVITVARQKPSVTVRNDTRLTTVDGHLRVRRRDHPHGAGAAVLVRLQPGPHRAPGTRRPHRRDPRSSLTLKSRSGTRRPRPRRAAEAPCTLTAARPRRARHQPPSSTPQIPEGPPRRAR